MYALLNNLKNSYYNLKGFRTNKKLVVFESDDWGSIRFPSSEILSKLKEKNIPIDKTHYKYDALESNDDLSKLSNVLLSFSDKQGNHPVFTLNTVVANPDFKRIRESDFQNYFYEYFTQNYLRYDQRDRCEQLIFSGIEKGIFYPQFHGREHLNVKRWMTALQNGSSETSLLFDYEMFGLPAKLSTESRRCYQRAFDLDDKKEMEEKCNILKDGLKVFEKIFGFKSRTMIAPNYFWFDELERCAFENRVELFQGQRAQFYPDYKGKHTPVKHFMGEKNKLGQFYSVRNCYFEPTQDPSFNWVDQCLGDVSNAFFFNKPAIICSHRVNYIGSINPTNRDTNLERLYLLIKKIIERWPDVLFANSETILDEFNSKKTRSII